MERTNEESALARIETTLPKPWEVEQSFHDVLYDWMGRAPWLALSLAAHLCLFFLLMAIPWDEMRRREERTIVAALEETEVPEFVEPEPEPLEPELEPAPIEEPVPQDAELPPSVDDALDDPATADPDPSWSSPFDDAALNSVIGIGGGAGNDGHIGGPRGSQGPRGSRTEKAVTAGLEWLAAHQSDDGSWDADGFMDNCGEIGSTRCGGAGQPTHDVGLTGLALLAFLGDGNTSEQGPFRDVVRRGMRWLVERQDPDTGLLGERASHDFVYDHAIATLALCENHYFTPTPLSRRSAQAAVNYAVRARNPYGAWRYDVPPIGDNDTSVTGWMVFALTSAREAGLTVDPAALDGALSWIDEVTDPVTGRVGYESLGSLSSRTPANEHYPRAKGEAMTAVGLLCRIFLGQDPGANDVLRKHADLLARTPPAWDPEGFGCDMYYWYYGTYAMFQMGGAWWRAWNEAMKSAVLPSQRGDGDESGSWDPVGPWGHAGGRVYATALMTLCLEVYFRYAKVLGAR
jgi:hypothetical protein